MGAVKCEMDSTFQAGRPGGGSTKTMWKTRESVGVGMQSGPGLSSEGRVSQEAPRVLYSRPASHGPAFGDSEPTA